MRLRYVKTDIQINSENSGGGLFKGNSEINTWKIAITKRISFTIDFSEVANNLLN